MTHYYFVNYFTVNIVKGEIMKDYTSYYCRKFAKLLYYNFYVSNLKCDVLLALKSVFNDDIKWCNKSVELKLFSVATEKIIR